MANFWQQAQNDGAKPANNYWQQAQEDGGNQGGGGNWWQQAQEAGGGYNWWQQAQGEGAVYAYQQEQQAQQQRLWSIAQTEGRRLLFEHQNVAREQSRAALDKYLAQRGKELVQQGYIPIRMKVLESNFAPDAARLRAGGSPGDAFNVMLGRAAAGMGFNADTLHRQNGGEFRFWQADPYTSEGHWANGEYFPARPDNDPALRGQPPETFSDGSKNLSWLERTRTGKDGKPETYREATNTDPAFQYVAWIKKEDAKKYLTESPHQGYVQLAEDASTAKWGEKKKDGSANSIWKQAVEATSRAIMKGDFRTVEDSLMMEKNGVDMTKSTLTDYMNRVASGDINEGKPIEWSGTSSQSFRGGYGGGGGGGRGGGGRGG